MGKDVKSQDRFLAVAIIFLLVLGIVLREVCTNVLALDTELFIEVGRLKDLICAGTYFGVSLLSVVCFGTFVLCTTHYMEANLTRPKVVKVVSVVLLIGFFMNSLDLILPDALLFSVYEDSVDENDAMLTNALQIFFTGIDSDQ